MLTGSRADGTAFEPQTDTTGKAGISSTDGFVIMSASPQIEYVIAIFSKRILSLFGRSGVDSFSRNDFPT